MTRLYFLACVILTPWLVSGQTIYGLYGKMLQLNPGTTGPIDNMLWKHNGNKVVEFSGQEEEVYGQFKDRVILDWKSAELNITDLRYDDSGEYKLEVLIGNKLKNFNYKVMVIDEISKPTISCDINNNTSGTRGTQATLTCSADSQASVIYEWASDGKILQGSKLKISLGEEDDDKTHNCTVTNPLGSEKATFTAKDCYPAKTSFALLAPAIAVPLIVILLAVVLGLYFLKQKKKACFADMEGKDFETPQEDEHKKLIDRTPTIPSTQRLNYPIQKNVTDQFPKKGHVEECKRKFDPETGNHKDKTTCLPTPPKKPARLDPVNQPVNNNDAEAHVSGAPPESKVPECEPSVTEKANEPEPAGVSDQSEDIQDEAESSISLQRGYVMRVSKRFQTNFQGDSRAAVGLDHIEDTKDDVVPPTVSENPETHVDNDKKTCPPSSPKKSSHLDSLNQPGNNKENAEKDESTGPSENKVPECEPSDTEKANEPDTQADVESSTAPPTKGYVTRVSKRFQTNFQGDSRAAVGLDHIEDTKDDVVPPTVSENPETHVDNDKKTCPPSSPKKSSHLDSLNQPGNNKENAEKDESTGPSENKVPECEPSDTETANEPDTQADVESSTAPPTKANLNKEKGVRPPIAKKPIAPLLNNNKNDAEAHEPIKEPPENKVPECEPSDTEKANEPDTQADVESSTAPPTKGHVTRVSKRFQTNFQRDSRAAVRLDHIEDTKDDVVPPTVSENPETHIDNDKKTCPPSSPKKSSHLDSLNQPGNNKENAEKDESTGPSESKVPECEPSDTEKANEPDTQADVESSTAPPTKANLNEEKGVRPPIAKKPIAPLLNNNKNDAEAHEPIKEPPENKVPECEPSDTEKANEPDTQADVESSTAPPTKESDNSHPANDSPPVPKPRSRSTAGSDNTAAEHK